MYVITIGFFISYIGYITVPAIVSLHSGGSAELPFERNPDV